MQISENEKNKIRNSKEYLNFCNDIDLISLSNNFVSIWKYSGVSSEEIHKWCLGNNIRSKIVFVEIIMETWEKNFCTFFEYGRIISNNNEWYYIENTHSQSRNNKLNISFLNKKNEYIENNLLNKIQKLQKENTMLRIKLKENSK